VGLADPRDLAVDLALEPGSPALGGEFVRGDLAEHRARAVGEYRRQLDHVLDREAVRDRVRAAGVVAEHAAEGRAIRRRGVGTEADVATERRAQLAFEVVHLGHYTRWSRGNRYGYYSRVTARFAVLALLLALATGSEAAPAAPGFKVRLIDGKTTLDSRDLIG